MIWRKRDRFGNADRDGKTISASASGTFFNISHSGEWIACALGNVLVGIDIQYHREIKLEQTARKICTPQEWKLFTQADTEKEKRIFCFRSGQKESYLKFTGDGIRRELCEISYEGCRFYRLVMPEGYSGDGMCGELNTRGRKYAR